MFFYIEFRKVRSTLIVLEYENIRIYFVWLKLNTVKHFIITLTLVQANFVLDLIELNQLKIHKTI